MRKEMKWMLGFLMGILLVCNGCASMTRNQDKPLEPANTLRFADIPIPGGFKILPQMSYSFENNGVRVALLKYKGSGSSDQVLNFYKEQMPISRWNLINISEFGQRMLNYEREDESCIITIQPLTMSTLVAISVGPKSKQQGGRYNSRDDMLK
jgi:hypothetical protein